MMSEKQGAGAGLGGPVRQVSDAAESSDSAGGVPALPKRPADTHKGQCGRSLLVGGSRGMSGSIALSGMATLRSGAGLVTLAVPTGCLETIAQYNPCYMTIPLPEDAAGRLSAEAWPDVVSRAAEATCVACGPGLGRSDAIVDGVVSLYTRCRQPLVIDADGLNALARRAETIANPPGPRVLTPHLGEFRRLVGREEMSLAEARELAPAWAGERGVVLLLKGHRTLVTDGQRTAENTTGNPGMATGGAGDVLTGIINGLLAQGMSAWEAARLAAHVHGLAGDRAAATWSQTALTAVDILAGLADAFRALEG